MQMCSYVGGYFFQNKQKHGYLLVFRPPTSGETMRVGCMYGVVASTNITLYILNYFRVLQFFL